MKKPILLACGLMALLTAFAQEETTEQKTPVILPGRGKINVERLNGKIDTRMDISRLSISELRVLRNAFAARQGYCFREGDLRAIFNTTTWYPDTMYGRWEREFDEPDLKYHYSKDEQAFMQRLKAREDALRQDNHKTTGGDIVNMDNLLNPYQLTTFEPALREMLGRQGFAIVPAKHNQLFHVYEKNDYNDFPNFVTTDLYLQLFHLYFDAVLREVEEQKLDSLMTVFALGMQREMAAVSRKNKEVAAAADFGEAWMAVAAWLFGHDKAPETAADISAPAAYQVLVKDEIDKVFSAEASYSDLLEYRFPGPLFNYSLFRPRGHYTRSALAARYFRGMMWLQTAHFGTDKPEKMKQIALMASVLGSRPALLSAYKQVFEPITYLMGTPDNVTILQVIDELRAMDKPINKLLESKESMKKLTRRIEEIAQRQMRIVPKFVNDSRYQVDLMPQRYQPDGAALLEMVDANGQPSRRSCPKGLDWMAAMGMPAAERILLDELKEPVRWSDYPAALARAKAIADSVDWHRSIATQWMDALRSLSDTTSGTPYFMRTGQWAKKNLNASLASWAELKHDVILYAKQPSVAECGDGGPDEPVVRGYVEPNITFWHKAIALIDSTQSVLQRYNLVTPKAQRTTKDLREQVEFCLRISQKELQGTPVSDEEYDQIERIGSTVEYLSLDLLKDQEADYFAWDDITSADKQVAVVADVFTANGDNVPLEQKTVLYEAMGPAYEIYAVVEIDGYLYLTRGAVFSYREFQRALTEPRMTDEEWQQHLKEMPKAGLPEWMEEITAPVEGMSNDNEEVFYSSGC